MSRLSKDEFVQYAPEEPGTVHVHHCKEGSNNDRLYVTRKEDGTILAYCHHCGASGYHNVLGSRTLQSAASNQRTYDEPSENRPLSKRPWYTHKRAAKLARQGTRTKQPVRDVRTGASDDGEGPEHAGGVGSTPFTAWCRAGQEWWLGCGLTPEEGERAGVRCIRSEEKLTLPIWNRGVRVGEIVKRFDGTGPKYLTAGSAIHQIIPAVDSSVLGYSDRRVLIVEDLRSAYKCSRVIDTLPLLGTTLRDEHVAGLMEANVDFAYIYLDNDNAQVKAHATSAYRRLAALGIGGTIILDTVDPKVLTTTELLKRLA